MSASGKPRTALQLIFAFFLGLMVTAFVGIGVYTFYPDNLEPLQEEVRELRDQRRALVDTSGASGLDESQQADLASLDARLRDSERRLQDHREAWSRGTSIILILLATFVMAISLIRADQLPVISNGLLLGGVFTMLYGVGWCLGAGDSTARFWVMTFALIVTLALGWLRFGRRRTLPAAAAPTPEFGDLAARVDSLERRLDATADAMRQE